MTTSTDQAKYWVAFNRISTIGRARFAILESYFGDLETAWRAGSSDLAAAGLDQRSVRAIVSRRPSISPDAEWERLEKLGIDAITVRDPAYPSLLREVYDYPPVLYVKAQYPA
ncbi:Protein Smf [Geodia barretti]|uniref:Protein Smf n=1 Tax=Geodia barretti TaxID=519541 RepID=A0AA35SW33_GEOBA|nr:Protein Smf [Geodia barretti]